MQLTMASSGTPGEGWGEGIILFLSSVSIVRAKSPRHVVIAALLRSLVNNPEGVAPSGIEIANEPNTGVWVQNVRVAPRAPPSGRLALHVGCPLKSIEPVVVRS